MDNLKNIFAKKLTKATALDKAVTAAMICDAFDKALVQVFGDEILKEARAISYRCGTLKVGVNSPSLSQEIQGHWGSLLDEKTKIKKFIFEVGTQPRD